MEARRIAVKALDPSFPPSPQLYTGNSEAVLIFMHLTLWTVKKQFTQQCFSACFCPMTSLAVSILLLSRQVNTWTTEEFEIRARAI